MKLSFRIYLLAGILLVSALISARTTLKKMRDSAYQTDKILVSLDELNKNQEKAFLQVERDLKNHITWKNLKTDSLNTIKSPLKNNYKTISFATVSHYRSYQVRMETKNLYYYELIKSLKPLDSLEKGRQEPGTSPDYQDKEVYVQICIYQEIADSLKNKYNQSARQHNSYIKGFPRNFYSSFFNFQSKAYIQP